MGEAQSPARRPGGILAVVGVFALGLICGAALLFAGARLMRSHSLPFGPRSSDRAGRYAIAHMTRELDLDAEQQEKVRAVIERTRGHVHEALEQSRAEIRALLRPDQQEKFDRMRPAGPHRPGHGRPPAP
jgi:Spy/CpxP family protein refolding chaperone